MLNFQTYTNAAAYCALILDQNDTWIIAIGAYNSSCGALFKLFNKLQTLKFNGTLTENKYPIL